MTILAVEDASLGKTKSNGGLEEEGGSPDCFCERSSDCADSAGAFLVVVLVFMML